MMTMDIRLHPRCLPLVDSSCLRVTSRPIHNRACPLPLDPHAIVLLYQFLEALLRGTHELPNSALPNVSFPRTHRKTKWSTHIYNCIQSRYLEKASGSKIVRLGLSDVMNTEAFSATRLVAVLTMPGSKHSARSSAASDTGRFWAKWILSAQPRTNGTSVRTA